MVAETIVRFGSEEQKARYVPRSPRAASRRRASASPSLTPAPTPPRCAPRARRDGKGWVLNGSKQWITSGDRAGVIVVWARTGEQGAKGISCFLVEGGASGLHVGRHEEKMGLRASSTVSLSFEDLPRPARGDDGQAGAGLLHRAQRARGRPHRHRRPGGWHRHRGPGRSRCLCEGAPRLRAAHRQLPGHPLRPRRRGYRAVRGAAAHACARRR